MIAKLASLLFVFALIAINSRSVQAEQFVARHGNRQVVVHTNPIPVILHRAVPPNYGRHITLREYKASYGSKTGSNTR
jgi:hypothetical protein